MIHPGLRVRVLLVAACITWLGGAGVACQAQPLPPVLPLAAPGPEPGPERQPAPAALVPPLGPLDLTPIVQGPPQGVPPSGAPALLIHMPGALLSQHDSDGLLAALATASNRTTEIELWAVAAAVPWASINFNAPDAKAVQAIGDAFILGALDAALAQGFPLEGTRDGAWHNVFVSMHSASSLFAFGVPLQRATGAALLGAALLGTDGLFWPSANAFPKPLLHLSGQLDGVHTTPRAALAAADAARGALQLGARTNAGVKPVSIIMGMNHAQLNNGKTNYKGGDLQPDVSDAQARGQVADVLLSFIAANMPAVQRGSAAAAGRAVDALLANTTAAAAFLSPYLEALGRSTPQQLMQTPPPAEAAALAPAFGGELIPPAAGAVRSDVAHPGELAVAERFCAQVQLREVERALAEGQNSSAPGRVVVSATAHTSNSTFDAAQPSVVAPPGNDSIVVQAHCYLYRTGLETTNLLSGPISPVYLIKLASGEAVAQALGPPARIASAPATAADVNRDTWAAAKAGAAAAVTETFGRRGADLIFLPDSAAGIATLADWKKTALSINCTAAAGQRNNCTMVSPTLPPPYNGTLYFKSPSLAWMHQWLMVGGLRAGQLPPPPPPPPLPPTMP